jgi:sugar fermentation stimulation protein A
MADRKRITVGKLGELEFSSGWYVYVGSASRALTPRISRHLRKRKRFRWHIDYLRDQASEVLALPVRSTLDQECSIADSLQPVLSPHSPGFGSSDCTCQTHLFYSVKKPLDRRDFHEILEQFRMPSIPSSEF